MISSKSVKKLCKSFWLTVFHWYWWFGYLLISPQLPRISYKLFASHIKSALKTIKILKRQKQLTLSNAEILPYECVIEWSIFVKEVSSRNSVCGFDMYVSFMYNIWESRFVLEVSVLVVLARGPVCWVWEADSDLAGTRASLEWSSNSVGSTFSNVNTLMRRIKRLPGKMALLWRSCSFWFRCQRRYKKGLKKIIKKSDKLEVCMHFGALVCIAYP